MSKDNGGMTLVEVLVALAIVFIVFLGLSGAGLVVLSENIKNTQRDEAVSVAEAAIQDVRNTSFANLAAAPDDVLVGIDNVPRQIRGLSVNYGISRTVKHLDAENLQVTVDVGWNRIEHGVLKPYGHRIITIVRKR